MSAEILWIDKLTPIFYALFGLFAYIYKQTHFFVKRRLQICTIVWLFKFNYRGKFLAASLNFKD